MKLSTIALAGALSLTSTFALAQMGGANGSGANLPETSGSAVNGGGAVVGTKHNGMHSGTHSGMSGTTGMGSGRDPNGGNPNGTAGGPTSLSGTGSSEYGGNGTAGTTNGR